MNPYIILTDSSSDLPESFCEGMPLEVAQLDVIVAGEPPRANRDVDNASFYAKLREKKTATTAAVNLEKFLHHGVLFFPLICETEVIITTYFSGLLQASN